MASGWQMVTVQASEQRVLHIMCARSGGAKTRTSILQHNYSGSFIGAGSGKMGGLALLSTTFRLLSDTSMHSQPKSNGHTVWTPIMKLRGNDCCHSALSVIEADSRYEQSTHTTFSPSSLVICYCSCSSGRQRRERLAASRVLLSLSCPGARVCARGIMKLVSTAICSLTSAPPQAGSPTWLGRACQ